MFKARTIRYFYANYFKKKSEITNLLIKHEVSLTFSVTVMTMTVNTSVPKVQFPNIYETNMTVTEIVNIITRQQQRPVILVFFSYANNSFVQNEKMK